MWRTSMRRRRKVKRGKREGGKPKC